jgi:tRNA 2-selenouridine synthase
MPRSLNYTQQPWTQTYSEIIDVRSQSEFAEDRVPGAINLPVLNDAQRAKVGTIYKQICPFEARKVGASLVAENIARHLDQHFAHKDKHYRPLVYCWRGGQRSNSMAMVLSQIGWSVTVLEGGYKTYRAYVRDQLTSLPEQLTFRVLGGLTGSGKTYILQQLAQHGIQVLDLEGLANHRGSLLGQEWESKEILSPLPPSSPAPPHPISLSPQPSQKYFESLLLEQLHRFDANRPVWVEAESNKIGGIYLPQSLWQQMKQSEFLEIELPLTVRIEWLLQEYPHFIACPDLLKRKLGHLKSRYGREKINHWYRLIEAEQWHTLVGDLLTCHYDPAYRRSIAKCFSKTQTLQLSDLSEASINALINRI